MAKDKKLSMEEMIEKLDAEKKVNPLDLSSDQDLSIALMNLISLEEHFFFSGAKTEKPGFYDLINVVRSMRSDLMKRIVKKNTTEDGEVWCISKHLLATSMRLKEVADKANMAGKTDDAIDLYSKAYDMYSLFWGINMDLVDLDGVKRILPPEAYAAKSESGKQAKKTENLPEIKSEDRSMVKRLGAWVKNAVNCCIE